MPLLLTAPYDPWKQTSWVPEIMKMGMELRAQREKQQQQMAQQALQDQRRAFEFDRTMEFNRARTAADDARADAVLGLQIQDRAPFTLPPGTSNANVPTLDASPTPALPASDADSGLNMGDTPTPTASTPAASTVAPAAPASADVSTSLSGLNTEPVDPSVPVAPAAPPATGGVDGTPIFEDKFGIPRSPLDNVRTPVSTAPTVPMLPSGGGAPEVLANPLIPGTVPTNPKPGAAAKAPSSEIDDLAASLAKYKIPVKAAQAAITSAVLNQTKTETKTDNAPAGKAQVRNFADGTTRQLDSDGTWKILASKPTTDGDTMESVVGDASYNAQHGTYQRADGSEFFPARTANGRWTVKPFEPSQKPAKFMWGDNGEVYPFSAQGEPLKPVPDGVQLRDHAHLQTAEVPGVGRVIINPDQSTRTLIPEGVTLTAKQKDQYTNDAAALRKAQVDLDVQTKLLKDNPSKTGVSWFGGGTKSAVDDAQKKFDDAKAAVEDWQKQYPQLAAKNLPAAPQPSGKMLDVQGARAILQEAGGDKEKARAIAKQRGYSF